MSGFITGNEGNNYNPVNTFDTVADLKACTNLKECMVVTTKGYYKEGDGGKGTYRLECNENEEGVFKLHGNLKAFLLDNTINYKQFGAVGDGKNDDGKQIKEAHTYANKYGIPVVNAKGEYWIKSTRGIKIQTDTSLIATKIHIDESYNTPDAPVFIISGKKPSFSLDPSILPPGQIRKGATIAPTLSDYTDHLIIVEDDNTKIGKRSGKRGWSMSEFFVVTEHGKLVGDIAWNFDNITSITAYPLDKAYLTVQGGQFIINGQNTLDDPDLYTYSGFYITRSRTIIRNQTISLENGVNDDSTNPNQGFYNFSKVFDVTLENVRLIPREQVHHDGTKVPKGTYGIGGRYVLYSTFRNVLSEGDSLHWGVFGTNLFKNFTVDKCKLNRVDVHFHCWNLHVKDSDIGYRGFTLTGGGDLIIENTRRHGNYFISFRNDYGARWDGNIFIDKCRLVQTDSNAQIRLLSFLPSDVDYGYPLVVGENITVRDFIFDCHGVENSIADILLLMMPKFGRITKTGDRIKFPENILCENVRVTGRDKGVDLIKWKKPNEFITSKPGKADPSKGELITNTTLKFKGVDTAYKANVNPKNENIAHMHFSVLDINDYIDEYAPIPKIIIEDCPYVNIQPKGGIADIHITRCKLQAINSCGDTKGYSRITVDSCDIRSNVNRDAIDTMTGSFYLKTVFPVKFISCTIHPPIVEGTVSPEYFDLQYGEIVNIADHTVGQLHLGTILSPAVRAYFKDKITQDLTNALQSKNNATAFVIPYTEGTKLPAPGSLYRGKFYTLKGKPDKIYVCKKLKDGSYGWVQIA